MLWQCMATLVYGENIMCHSNLQGITTFECLHIIAICNVTFYYCNQFIKLCTIVLVAFYS